MVGNSLLDALNNLIALGYEKSFPKWSQWEEIVVAGELVNEISNNGYRTLRKTEFIKAGDQHGGGVSEWMNSIAIGRRVDSQTCGSIYAYRRPVKIDPRKMNKATKAKLIEAMEAILYMGADEKYNNWEASPQVINARKLIAKEGR